MTDVQCASESLHKYGWEYTISWGRVPCSICLHTCFAFTPTPPTLVQVSSKHLTTSHDINTPERTNNESDKTGEDTVTTPLHDIDIESKEEQGQSRIAQHFRPIATSMAAMAQLAHRRGGNGDKPRPVVRESQTFFSYRTSLLTIGPAWSRRPARCLNRGPKPTPPPPGPRPQTPWC